MRGMTRSSERLSLLLSMELMIDDDRSDNCWSVDLFKL